MTIKCALEEKLQIKISGDMPIFPWLMRHAAFLLNHVSVQSGSRRTAYEMLTDCKYSGTIAELGEAVFFYKARPEKAEAKWQRGIWVGKSWTNDGHIILNEQGGFESKVVRRLPEERRWNVDLITGLKGLPWDYSGAKLRKLLPKKPRAAIVPLGLTDAEAIQAGRDVAEALRESSSSSSKSSSSNPDEAASDPGSVADGSMREGGSSDGRNKSAKHALAEAGGVPSHDRAVWCHAGTQLEQGEFLVCAWEYPAILSRSGKQIGA